MVRLRSFAVLLVATVTVACGGADIGSAGAPTATIAASSPIATAGASVTPTVTGTANEAATASTTATAPPTAPATAAPTRGTATPAPGSLGIRATRLQIPSQNLDAEVVLSYTTPDTRAPYPGCPAPSPGGQTLTVPNFGIATPEQAFDGLEHVAWIFGHSRWQGAPGLLMVLQDLGHGDVLLVDGIDRVTGDAMERRRYVVEGVYLADRESGGRLVEAEGARPLPRAPAVILQTSVREWGADRPWILDRSRVMATATNLVEGDLEDPCKYLLLFVIARLS